MPDRFVRVVPLARTPVGVESFDYRLPDGMFLRVGDVIRVPLRQQRVEAVVAALLDTSPFASKAREIETQAPLTHLGESWIALLQWLSARTFQSQPTIAKAWLRLLPKKLTPWTTQIPKRLVPGDVHTHWVVDPEQHLLAEARKPHEGRRLILTPFAQQAERLAQALQAPVLLSDDPKTTATRTWIEFLEGQTPILVSTRIGAWLGLYADTILLLEPENDDHKQDDATPRFDTRLVAAWLHQQTYVSLHTFGRTPPLHVQRDAANIPLYPKLCLKQWAGKSPVPGIGLDALEAFLEPTDRPRVLIHPIRGLRARAQCRVCHELVSCAVCGTGLRRRPQDAWCDLCKKASLLPEACTRCGGQDFTGSSAGIELIKQAWAREEHPDTEWRTGSPLELDTPFPLNARVLVTEPALIGGGSEDVRRGEKLCRAYRALAAHVAQVSGELILQVAPDDTERWIAWLTPEGVRTSAQEERQARNLFRYPPSVRLVKLLVEGSEAEAGRLTDRLTRATTKHPLFLSLRGPFLAEGRPKTKPRYVLHALFQPSVTESALIAFFAPYAQDAIIDLDPIAFLR